MKTTTQRLAEIPTTIFTTMSRLAVEHQAVNLGQGFPDFDGPSWIIDEALQAMRSGHNQYAPMSGTLSLKRAVVAYQKRFYGMEWNPDTEITVTAGATEALFSTMLALIEPGDEVIVFEPYYDSHQANILLAGGTPRYVTLRKPDFRFDAEELERLVTPATTMIILNNPDNPTGKVYRPDELAAIAEIAIRHDLLVLSDEVYEFLTYDVSHIPIATLPGMRDRTITISSTGKTFGMTGWKIGFAMAREELTRAIQKVHQFVTFAVNTPGQHTMAHALGRLPEYLPGFRAEYRRKRDLLCAGLKDTVFAPHAPRGSYFVMADIPAALGLGDVEVAMKLVAECGVALIPPSAFYAVSGDGATMLRFCFAKKDETIHEGIRRLSGFRIESAPRP
jgi:aspartate/methionine/tyrosine aminotransferase